jgi:hypothetical protein
MAYPDQPNRLRDPSIEASFVRGGPFYSVQRAIRLLTPESWNLGRRIFVAICIAWLPLVLLTLATQPQTLRGLLTDYFVNCRLFVAVPVLLAGQILMEWVFRTIVGYLRQSGMLLGNAEAQMDVTILQLLRLRDSILAEVVIVALAYVHAAAVFRSRLEIVAPWALHHGGMGTQLSLAGLYYALVSQLVYQFLLGISIWKWILWCVFLFRLSRLDLELVPTHPDQHGGLGVLGMSALANSPTVFAGCAAIGSTWRTEILQHRSHLLDFKIDAAVLVLIILLVSMGPLLVFVPRLGRLRRQGILQYSILGQLHSVDFHKKWILNRRGHEEEFLTAPEISTLTDYASSYEKLEELQPFPIDRGALVGLVAAIVVPLLPVVLAEIPFMEVVKGLFEAVK